MSRPSKIHYFPNLTIAENAERNGVSMAGMNYYIRVNNIDRRYNNTSRIIRRCREYYINHPDANKGKIAQEMGYSRNIVNEYWEYITKGIPYTKMHEGKAIARQEIKKQQDAEKVQTKMQSLKLQIESLIEEEHKNTDNLSALKPSFPYPTKSDLYKSEKETYNATEYLCYAFRRKDDTHKGDEMPLGNMCGGFPFEMEGQIFYTSENAYICGLFSTNSKEHQNLQKRLIAEQNGYLAKKEIRAKNYRYWRRDWDSFNVDWMLYCVWNKVQSNKDFREALIKVPYGAVIIENSTFQKVKNPDTSAYWGSRNNAIKDFCSLIQTYVKSLNLPSKAEEKRMVKGYLDDYCNVGEFIGTNEMGKILMYVKECLHKDVEPEIDYNLLKSKNIYLLGEEVSLKPCQRLNKKVIIEQPSEPIKDKVHKVPFISNAIIGAVCGDIIGSRYEQRKNRVYSTDFELFPPRSQYTDDTIHTIATMDWLLNDDRTDKKLCDFYYEYSVNNKFNGRGGVYGGSFKRWLEDGERTLYRVSGGNGAAMRVSPVAWAFDSENDVLEVAKQTARITHNSEEAIIGAQSIALCTYLARNGVKKDEIKASVEKRFGYNLEMSCEEWRDWYREQNKKHVSFDFNNSVFLCRNSVPAAIRAFLEADDFESAIRLAVSLGGDADTLGAMTGGIAEALFGVPEHIRKVVEKKMKPEFIPIINAFTQRYGE